ncbi:MAG TPA: SCO family protein, partial [Candidatus Baltobacteraceae bacterium]|nr:SCO family protein [Candidatus Baltobacteraceae bacterium]
MLDSKLPQTFWVGLLFLLSFLALAYLLSVAELKKQHTLPSLGKVENFTLTNQDGKVTTLADLTNHVWVADIIFTRCAGPCPRMTAQMKSIQDKLEPRGLAPATSTVQLVTLTTDPDYDSPAVMKKYGQHFDADFNRWNFLTGTKSEIGALAANSLKLSATPIDPKDQKNAADLFIHTTIFVIVDKHAQLRGIFQTGGEDVD